MSTQVEEERVLVVPTAHFRKLGYFQGFSPDVDRYRAALFDERAVSYRPRALMERDPDFKQLIPYCLFRHLDEAGQVRLFHYTRGTTQGEGRLHRKRSVGVGGHISSVDQSTDGGGPYLQGMRRELAEEVAIDTQYVEQCVGLINDDETEVGRVHLGVVHLIDLEAPAVRPLESGFCDVGFEDVRRLLAARDDFESWSRICMEALFERGS